MFGRIYGFDAYGQPDFKNTESLGDLPRAFCPPRGRMPLKQAPIFAQMSREGFLNGKHAIVPGQPGRTDDQRTG